MRSVRLAFAVIGVVATLRPASAWAGESADPNATTQASKLAEYYRRADERRAAKVVKLQAQLDKGSDPEAMATLKHDLARTYELMKGKGEDARRTYADILENHQGYSKSYEVAFRLAELHHNVILPGTLKDYDKAVKYYEQAIATCPPDVLLRQQAHLSLALIQWRLKQVDEGLRNLEEAHRFDPGVLKPDDGEGSPAEKEERLRQLRTRAERMRDHACRFLIVVQEDPKDPAKTLGILDELERKYAGDPRLVEMIRKEREATAKRGQKLIPQLNSVMSFPGGAKPDETVPAK